MESEINLLSLIKICYTLSGNKKKNNPYMKIIIFALFSLILITPLYAQDVLVSKPTYREEIIVHCVDNKTIEVQANLVITTRTTYELYYYSQLVAVFNQEAVSYMDIIKRN